MYLLFRVLLFFTNILLPSSPKPHCPTPMLSHHRQPWQRAIKFLLIFPQYFFAADNVKLKGCLAEEKCEAIKENVTPDDWQPIQYNYKFDGYNPTWVFKLIKKSIKINKNQQIWIRSFFAWIFFLRLSSDLLKKGSHLSRDSAGSGSSSSKVLKTFFS